MAVILSIVNLLWQFNTGICYNVRMRVKLLLMLLLNDSKFYHNSPA